MSNSAHNILPSGLKYIKKILLFEELASTNDCALELEKEGEPSGTLIIAKRQSAGRGRLRRSWFMGPGDIAMTLLLRAPDLPLFELAKLPWLPALSAVEALAELNICARLKWPNDIIIKSNSQIKNNYFGSYLKVGGILVENIFKEQRVSASVLGLGLNVRPNSNIKAQVPHAGYLALINASLSSTDIWPLLIKKLDQNLHRLLAPDGGADAQARYENYCLSIGRYVTVYSGDTVISGTAIGLNESGFLVVNDGIKQHIIYAGDVVCRFD